jgi:hypothetical protein
MHIYNSTRIFYQFAKVFGIWPHSFKVTFGQLEKHSKSALQTFQRTPHYWSIISLVWTLCILIVYVWAISFLKGIWLLDFIADATKTSVTKWTQTAQLYMVLSLSILLIIYNLFNHWNLWALIEGISQVDAALQKRFHVILDYEYNIR